MNKKAAATVLSLAVVGAALLATTGGAASMGKYGNCAVTGKMGAYKLTPAVPGQLTVEVNLPAPSFWNGDTPTAIKDGFEYCMAANIAYRAGLPKVGVKNVAWDALVAGQTKAFDFALSQISITDERKKVVDFSAPYFFSDIGVLVRKGTKVDANAIKDLKIGVQQGTTGETYAKETLKIAADKLKVFPDTPGMFTALQAKQVDVAMTDTAIVLGQAKASNGLFNVVAQYKTGETYGALFPKGSKNRGTFDKIVAEMVKDGTIKALSTKYLGGDPASIPVLKP